MNRKVIEWAISLGITLVLLALIVGGVYWYRQYMSQYGYQMDMSYMWWANAIGGVAMLFIIHHFVKEPKDKDQ